MTTTRQAFTIQTPWGVADHYENLGQGIFTVFTPSHGGIFVPYEMLHCIPEEQRKEAAKWSGSEQWYEEDCCWAFVAVAFPDRFKPDAVENAKAYVATWNKEIGQ